MTRDEWRTRLLTCRVCKDYGHSHVRGPPRYGTGPRVARLMLIGQNPPTDPARGLHGAWMLHYPEQADVQGRSEKLVHELVTRCGLLPKQVYATQLVKCSTSGNAAPGRLVARVCGDRWLQSEVNEVHNYADEELDGYVTPIIVFGSQAEDYVKQIWKWVGREKDFPEYWEHTFKVAPDGYAPEQDAHSVADISPSRAHQQYRMWSHGYWLFAPHPAVVGRFLDRELWLSVLSARVREMIAKASCGEGV